MVALAPYLAGIVIVIGRTLLIHLFESSLGRLTLDDVITAGLNALYTVLNEPWMKKSNLFGKSRSTWSAQRPTITHEESSAISRMILD